MSNTGINISFAFCGFKTCFCTPNRTQKIFLLITLEAKGEIWWNISEKGRRSQLRKRRPFKEVQIRLYKRSSSSSETIGSCNKYLQLISVFKLYAETWTSAYKEHNSCESWTIISVVIGTAREASKSTHIYCFRPSHFSFMYQPDGWILYNLDIQASQILRTYFTEIVFYLHVLKIRVYIIILFNHFYLL